MKKKTIKKGNQAYNFSNIIKVIILVIKIGRLALFADWLLSPSRKFTQ